MSAHGITDVLCRAIEADEHDFLLCNYANADMVGHTGVLPAVIKAVETVDSCLARVLASAEQGGSQRPRHGRPRQLRDDDRSGDRRRAHRPHDQPGALRGRRPPRRPGCGQGGSLRDVAPTVLRLLGIEPPAGDDRTGPEGVLMTKPRPTAAVLVALLFLFDRPGGRPGRPSAGTLALPRHPQGAHGHARSSRYSAATAGGSGSRRTTARSSASATTSAPRSAIQLGLGSARGNLRAADRGSLRGRGRAGERARWISRCRSSSWTFSSTSPAARPGTGWRRSSGVGGGLTFADSTASDTSGFELGNKIYFAPHAGFRYLRHRPPSSPGRRPGAVLEAQLSRQLHPGTRRRSHRAARDRRRPGRASGARRRGSRSAWASASPPSVPVSLTRTVGFRAVHRLYRPDWSEARNREVFGPLSDPPGHPHDYRCAVTVAGAADPMGMVIDLGRARPYPSGGGRRPPGREAPERRRAGVRCRRLCCRPARRSRWTCIAAWHLASPAGSPWSGSGSWKTPPSMPTVPASAEPAVCAPGGGAVSTFHRIHLESPICRGPVDAHPRTRRRRRPARGPRRVPGGPENR